MNNYLIVGLCAIFLQLLLWGWFRWSMNHSTKFMFNPNEIHHYDILVITSLAPLWKILHIITDQVSYLYTALAFVFIPIIIAADDIHQHRMQRKYHNVYYKSFLVRHTVNSWVWFFRK